MERVLKRAGAFLLLLCVTLTGAVLSPTETEASSQFDLVDMGQYDKFINYVDGYSLNIDKNLNVDMRFSEVGTLLESGEKRIEIYKQNVGVSGMAGYINYSNQFLTNKDDHFLEFSGVRSFNGNDVQITIWNRKKLSRVENDKNYYISMDIKKGIYCYSIIVKSTKPISEAGDYTYLPESFETFKPSKYPYMRQAQRQNIEDKAWNEETVEFYNKYFADDADITWGIFEPNTSVFDYNTLNYYENYFEYKFPILLNYSEFENKYKHPNLRQRLDRAYSHGKVLELTLQTTWQEGGNMVYDILDGEYDEFLRDYAKTIAEFEHPVMFRLGNEMNGDWCPYSSYHTSKDPLIFREFYKYVYSFFVDAGAANVIWVWNPNCDSFPNFNWNHEMMYYPGDKYVDIVGLTAYNTGDYYAATGEKWQEFDELYDDLYRRYVERFQQPLMITEFASANRGGDKNQWVINMFNKMSEYDKIKVAIWWDGRDLDPANGNIARSYFINEGKSLMDIFKMYLKEPWDKNAYA